MAGVDASEKAGVPSEIFPLLGVVRGSLPDAPAVQLPLQLLALLLAFESAVVPAPDEDRGSVVKAYVVLSKDYEPSGELAREIQDFCKAQTAPYKYPRRIEFIDELPKTTSGKIRRVELRQREKV
jgi:acyl-coenzyme A synthetase/AMP-(fatty) acid ligase